jgi:hypothetical protein
MPDAERLAKQYSRQGRRPLYGTYKRQKKVVYVSSIIEKMEASVWDVAASEVEILYKKIIIDSDGGACTGRNRFRGRASV